MYLIGQNISIHYLCYNFRTSTPMKLPNKKELLKQSFFDLKDDFEELAFLSKSTLSHLEKFEKELKAAKKHIRKQTFDLVVKRVKQTQNIFRNYLEKLHKLQKQAENNKKYSFASLKYLQENKNKYFDLVRTCQNMIGSLITSTDWQSPSFSFSLSSQAGRQTGKVTANINDYKRDGRLDNEEFEKLFRREYLDSPLKFLVPVFVTNSGMAAFTTILNFLIMEKKIKGKVLMGKSCYFEYKQLILKSLNPNVIEIAESQTEKIIETIKKERPSVIFLDSLSNVKEILIPDLKTIIQFLIKDWREETCLVIDNTCLATTFQPLKMILGKTRKINLMVFESLNKYYQFGLDRVIGGIIIAYGKDCGKIIDYREHLGTTITDNSLYSLPIPNRKMLEKRLARLDRNATLLSSYLEEYINKKKNCVVQKIIYPALKSHPCYNWTSDMPFHGSYFTIDFKNKYQKVSFYKKFIEVVLRKAKKMKVNLIGGTSFGLNTTRIYLTATRTHYGEPFVRVSLGTENLIEIKKLKQVFIAAIEKTSRFLLFTY